MVCDAELLSRIGDGADLRDLGESSLLTVLALIVKLLELLVVVFGVEVIYAFLNGLLLEHRMEGFTAIR